MLTVAGQRRPLRLPARRHRRTGLRPHHRRPGRPGAPLRGRRRPPTPAAALADPRRHPPRHLRGARTLTGTALLVPKQTRDRDRPLGTPQPPTLPARPAAPIRPLRRPGTAAEPDAPTNGRTRSRDGGRARCPECGEPARPRPPARWTTANGPRPDHSHLDGEPLCPVVTATGYHPAWPTTRRPDDRPDHDAARRPAQRPAARPRLPRVARPGRRPPAAAPHPST